MTTDKDIMDKITEFPDIEEAHLHPMSAFYNGHVGVTSAKSRKYKRQLLKVELGFPAEELISDALKSKHGYSLPMKNKDFKLIPFILFIKLKPKEAKPDEISQNPNTVQKKP